MTSRLAGQRALVTGAASGIGRAIAIALAEAGANVALVDRADEKTLAGVAQTIEQAGGRAFALRADIAE
jgi:NAD(P)-dependent dehydrogenase (short-subunit alcohol dehydrogenase family)